MDFSLERAGRRAGPLVVENGQKWHFCAISGHFGQKWLAFQHIKPGFGRVFMVFL